MVSNKPRPIAAALADSDGKPATDAEQAIENMHGLFNKLTTRDHNGPCDPH